LFSAVALLSLSDPGPRAGAPGAGFPYSKLNPHEISSYNQGFQHFIKSISVSKGLGPTFNGNGCAMCHSQPSIGGSGTGMNNPEEPHPNPMVALAKLDGATNSVPYFITLNGPVRVPRFLRNKDGSPDGSVHGIYTIAGRKDAKGCRLKQTDFAQAMKEGNIALRIPTALFGLGLVENTPDETLRENLKATEKERTKLGIGGIFNISTNDNTITRFGWKAQNKSLLIFAAEAESVEEGVTNELFPNKRNEISGCALNPLPEDSSSETQSDLFNFANFIRLSEPPKPTLQTESTKNGAKLFEKVSCVLCHTSTLRTGKSIYTGMSDVAYHPYSDFALHHMGSGLADGISQGTAGRDQFRTAPLWGVGQRLFFMHDGRTTDLLKAIQEHSSPNSEADEVIKNFNSLDSPQKQDILNFLRSL
jgi:CxxC motif-containing protein (DUF1111 family)